MSHRCLIVGGARHLGAALAAELATDGADVAVSSRSPASAIDIVTRIESRGRRSVAVGGDVGVRLEARHLVHAAAAALGGLDLVVFAASGPFRPTPPEDIDESGWDASLDVLARGFLFCAQAAREVFLSGHGQADRTRHAAATPSAMVAGGAGPDVAAARCGTIVAVTDIVTGDPWPRLTPHFAGKAAEIMVVQLLASAWRDDGVAVCGVAPGPVDIPDDDRREATLRAATRLGYSRLVRPAEVAGMILRCAREPQLNGGNHIVAV